LDSCKENLRARRSKRLSTPLRSKKHEIMGKYSASNVGEKIHPDALEAGPYTYAESKFFCENSAKSSREQLPARPDVSLPLPLFMTSISILYRGSLWLLFSGLLTLLLLTGCTAGNARTSPATSSVTSVANSSNTPSPANNESTISFRLSGGANGRYTVHAPLPTSKLRHGHREFTIDVEHGGASVFIVFYGYKGPGTYMLAQVINGGDVHIALKKNTASWDLSLQPQARCTLTIQSDSPTQSTGLDRMKGSFSCPRLSSSAPAHPQQPVTVSDGAFDIAIIVES
jgi:hypothetical protein